MKICVDVQGKEKKSIPSIHLPNTLLCSKKVIKKTLEKVDIHFDDATLEKIIKAIQSYVSLYKGSQLLEVEVFSKDGQYVHVKITL